MIEPLDEIFKIEENTSIEEIERRKLKTIFEWVVSFSVLFWAISLILHFGNDWIIIIKGVLLIGLVIISISTILSFGLAFFEYKTFDYYTRFQHFWLLLMSFMNGFSILLSLWFII